MAEYTLTVAPNGARRGRDDHPELPVTQDQIVATSVACKAAGAHGIHLHVRDAAGAHTLDAEHYHDAKAAVAEAAPGLAIQITTESAGLFNVAEQLDCLKALRPASASIALREMSRDPDMAAQAYALCAEAGTQVQHILYGPSCIELLRRWYADGTVPNTMRDVIFVLGQYVPEVLAQPQDLQPFLAATDDLNLNWTVCAFGRHEQACLLAAIAAGGDVRIGFENNMETPSGDLLSDNAASVAALITAATAAGHTLKES
ncbi:3-keto-5-aminohexanoate cleavage protein [Parasedimentitalea maritima]|uniref:3-keto-5-aminohexanoate cleavage protein n=1 Tax=Parasedimentitalea maritima TaxID=2578117 RepID=A0A6A4RL85_9RHOB|nr:3-keto-5-aminohexanoate cleavage protein [Zongyanglinia marina]KAE9632487.1 3-keto-5-aminohexanoate cleavage protein [Zongyanglinia marina]